MSDALSYAELDVQLLPARTVLSTFVQGAANGADAFGGIGLGIPILDKFFPGSGNAVGGDGQNANG